MFILKVSNRGVSGVRGVAATDGRVQKAEKLVAELIFWLIFFIFCRQNF